MRFATLITTFIVSAFVLITVLTSTVVYYTVDSTFEKGQERFIQRQLHNVRSMFINYVDTRERLVNDYAKFPMIRLGARHPESTRRTVNDFMDTLRIFGEKHQFVMLDRRGGLIHKTLDTPVPDMKGTGLLNRVKDSAKGGFSEIVKHDGEFFLNILAPVKDKDLVNGFFGCLLPARLMVETLELQKGDGINMHVSIRKKDLVIARAGGEAEGLTRTVEFMPPDYLISLSISDGFREEANHALVIRLVLFRVCLAGLLIVGVLAVMHRWIVQPLHIFGDMADQWGRGEAPETGSYRFWLKEFKDFRKQFEQMHARLLKREADLKEKTEELEAANERVRQDQSILIRQEKLSSIGQLAAGVAHELNTPISFVYSNFEILEGYLNSIKKVITEYEEKIDEEVVREIRGRYDMDYIMEDIESLVPDNLEGLVRVTDIVSTLKDFSRVDQTDRFSLVNIEDSIRTTLEVARNEIKYVAEVTTRFGGVGQVMCRADEINQVFLNIIVNAAQAVKEAGKTERGEILIETWEEDTAVCCSITDTGPGIPDEVIDKVFDPFYTTKPVGKGTGLGLNIAYDIVVNRHKGRLKVENSDRGGACFTVSLPLNPDTQPLLQKEDEEGHDHRDS